MRARVCVQQTIPGGLLLADGRAEADRPTTTEGAACRARAHRRESGGGADRQMLTRRTIPLATRATGPALCVRPTKRATQRDTPQQRAQTDYHCITVHSEAVVWCASRYRP
jgi:hypothetical protein